MHSAPAPAWALPRGPSRTARQDRRQKPTTYDASLSPYGSDIWPVTRQILLSGPGVKHEPRMCSQEYIFHAADLSQRDCGRRIRCGDHRIAVGTVRRSAVADALLRSGVRRAQHRVADLGGLVAVLERRAV